MRILLILMLICVGCTSNYYPPTQSSTLQLIDNEGTASVSMFNVVRYTKAEDVSQITVYIRNPVSTEVESMKIDLLDHHKIHWKE